LVRVSESQEATSSRRSPTAVISVVALATVSSVFPGLASGSLAVQASQDLGISEGTWGWTLSAFFLGAATGSVALGRLAQRIGPRRQLLGTTAGSAAVLLLIATVASSFTAIVLLLVLAGLINSAAQTAVNLALTNADLPRLGVAIATKQSAMPAASMLGGLAVPALALTLGWRWAYAMGSVVAAIACVGVYFVIAPGIPARTAKSRTTETSSRILVGVAVASFLMAYTSGAINAWTVSSGVDAGLSEGVAGLALSAAAATGICLRLVAGTRLDSSATPPFTMAARIFVVGVTGMALLALRLPGLHVVAALMAFGGGWIWPAFTNFAIVRANPTSAARATGTTQTGVYIGVMTAPVTTGVLVDRVGYPTMWLVVASVGVVAGFSLLALSRHFTR